MNPLSLHIVVWSISLLLFLQGELLYALKEIYGLHSAHHAISMTFWKWITQHGIWDLLEVFGFIKSNIVLVYSVHVWQMSGKYRYLIRVQHDYSACFKGCVHSCEVSLKIWRVKDDLHKILVSRLDKQPMAVHFAYHSCVRGMLGAAVGALCGALFNSVHQFHKFVNISSPLPSDIIY